MHKKKNFWGSCKLLEKVCDENEIKTKKQHACENFIDGRKHFKRCIRKTGVNILLYWAYPNLGVHDWLNLGNNWAAQDISILLQHIVTLIHKLLWLVHNELNCLFTWSSNFTGKWQLYMYFGGIRIIMIQTTISGYSI